MWMSNFVFQFSFVSIYFFIFLITSTLIYSLFKCVMLNFHIFVSFPVFHYTIVGKIILDMISIFLNLLRFVLQPNIWSILEKVSYEDYMQQHSPFAGWNVHYLHFGSILVYGLPCGSDGKESTCNAETCVDPYVGKISWRREWLPTPVFLPGEFHAQRSPVGSRLHGGRQRVRHNWETSTFTFHFG